VIHRCYDDIEANQIRDILEQEGISCQVASNIPHSVFPIMTDGLGEVRISVVEKEADKARKLIQEFYDPFNDPPVPDS